MTGVEERWEDEGRDTEASKAQTDVGGLLSIIVSSSEQVHVATMT